MWRRIDRVLVVTGDPEGAAERYRRLLGAEVVGGGRSAALAALRTVLRLGTSEVELLAPDGAGPADDFLRSTRGGLFAAGVAVADLDAYAAEAARRGLDARREDGRLLLPAVAPGLPVVVAPLVARDPAGLLLHLYEVTYLTPDFARATDAVAAAGALERGRFHPIRSEEFGYEGVLALFEEGRLDRLEVITPNDPAKTMGRFFAKRRASLYMCYGESRETGAIRGRLLEHAPGDWTGPTDASAPDNLFLHPRALGGLMIGVSRETVGWTWSGHPERVR